jgi:hypothetical protein
MFDDGGLSPFGNSPIFQTKNSKKKESLLRRKFIFNIFYVVKCMFGLARSLAESKRANMILVKVTL